MGGAIADMASVEYDNGFLLRTVGVDVDRITPSPFGFLLALSLSLPVPEYELYVAAILLNDWQSCPFNNEIFSSQSFICDD